MSLGDRALATQKVGDSVGAEECTERGRTHALQHRDVAHRHCVRFTQTTLSHVHLSLMQRLRLSERQLIQRRVLFCCSHAYMRIPSVCTYSHTYIYIYIYIVWATVLNMFAACRVEVFAACRVGVFAVGRGV